MKLPARLIPVAEKERGFTLIEILVVLVLIGVVVGGGVAGYRGLNERKLVEGAAKKAEQAIRAAQKNASSGVKPAGWCTDPETLQSYSVGMNRPAWSLANDEYEIRAECSDGSFVAVDRGTLPEGTEFRWNRVVTFNVLDGTAAQNRTQDVRSESDTSLRYRVVITTGGSVSFERM